MSHGVLHSASKSPLLLLVLAALVLLLLPVACVSGADSSADVSAPVRPSRDSADFDDEFEYAGGMEASNGEITLGDDDDMAADSALVEEKEPSAMDVFTDPSIAEAAANDKTRVARSLDWLHLHFEARQSPAPEDGEVAADAAPGRLLASSRKLGRSPLIVQMGSSQLLPELEAAILGATIGERRSVTLTHEQLLAHSDSAGLQPNVLPLAEGVEAVTFVLEIQRFDLDVKPVTLQDRFWNLLPMLAFFAFMGFRLRDIRDAVATTDKSASQTAARAGKAKKH